MEKQLIEKGLSQEEAHMQTSKKYNYSKEADEYYAKIDYVVLKASCGSGRVFF